MNTVVLCIYGVLSLQYKFYKTRDHSDIEPKPESPAPDQKYMRWRNGISHRSLKMHTFSKNPHAFSFDYLQSSPSVNISTR